MQDNVTTYWRISDNPSFQGYKSNINSGTYAVIGDLSAGTTYYVQIGTSETNIWGSAPADTAWSSTLEVVTAPRIVANKKVGKKIYKSTDSNDYSAYIYKK